MIRTHPHHQRRSTRTHAARAFTITELLVVIGIIVLLAGLLLVALTGVRSRALETQTISTMRGFAGAAEAFQNDHGAYPGVVPEHLVAQNPVITSTQNALLHLMGGYRILRPGASDQEAQEYEDFCDPDSQADAHHCFEYIFVDEGTGVQWELKVDTRRIGEGPVINGEPYAPYFTPGSREVRVVPGLASPATENGLPCVVDAWGQPIMYTRRMRTNGPLVGQPTPASPANRPQFVMEGLAPYYQSPGLGEQGKDQATFSILAQAQGPAPIDGATPAHSTFAQIIRHPGFGPPSNPLLPDHMGEVTPRGGFVLISAGRDGVYFSIEDGPGRPGDAVENIVEGEFGSPTIVDEYDDIRVFGGG